MLITKIEPLTKTKYKIELDGDFAFVLYKGEVSRFGMKEQTELSEELYTQIKEKVLLKRAKLRAMHLLTDMARTEKGLREKLRHNLYPEDIIEETLAYVRSFGYLDDTRYAQNFIESRKTSKSRKELYAALRQKGVSAEIIEQAFSSCYPEETEQEAIRHLLRKKRIDPSQISREERQKLYGYLARKGFSYEVVRSALELS
ncbi:MAG: regulatory protein RecX [Ruminococcus sp.]|nr:regulatory protein RecX [Ruminococcus sp.]